jgi:hypothetical protein
MLITIISLTILAFIQITISTVLGSVTGVKISQKIEKWLHAESDNHLK